MNRHLYFALALLLSATTGCGPALPLSRPEWSPRGDRAAFVRYAPETSNLYLLAPGSAEEPRLVEEGVERFAFSPTGAKLYYLRPPAKEGKKGGALISLDLLATEAKNGAPKTLLLVENAASLRNLLVAADGKIYLEKTGKDNKRRLLELEPASGKIRDLTPKNGDWHLLSGRAPGRPFAVLVRKKEENQEVLRLELPDGKESSLGSVAGTFQEIAPLCTTPDGRGVVLTAEEKKRKQIILIGSLKGKPAGRTFTVAAKANPIAANISTDGKTILFSVLVEEDSGEPGTEAWKLDLATGEASLVRKARGMLVGAPATTGSGRTRLEFTQGGLAAFEGNKNLPVRLWPVTIRERAGAARLFMDAGRNDAALEHLSAALSKAKPDTDRAALYVLKSEVLAKKGRRDEAANAYLESLLRYPVSSLKRTDAQIAKRLAAWSEAMPDHRILSLVAQAYKRSAAGDSPGAARSMREAAGFSGDRAWAAGLHFGYAMNLLKAGKGASAGPVFRKVSEAREFPQADWAAGLCVLAYTAGRRDDLAAEEIQRCNDRYGKSPLSTDFKALAGDLKSVSRKSRILERTPVIAGNGARLEAWPVTAAHLSFEPASTPAGRERRLAVIARKLYRVVIVPKQGAQQALLDRVTVRLSDLSFSPRGNRLAFLAGEPGERSLYAIDLRGKSRVGNLKDLLAGRLDPATRTEDYRWDDKRNIPIPRDKAD